MLFTKWLSDVTDRVLRKRTRKLARKVTQRSMSVASELLESRVVPTIDVTLAANGVLTIAGDTSANELTISVSGNVYTLETSTDTFNVSADSSSTAAGNGTGALIIGTSAAHVTSIVVKLGGEDDTLILDSTGDAISVTDTSGTDTLQGPDVTTTWTQSSLTVSGKAVTFSGIDVLQGGSSNDTFTIDSSATLGIIGGDGNDTFVMNAAVIGSVDGGADNDTLEGTQINGVTLTGAGGVDGFDGNETSITGGFDNINVLIGTGTSSTLKGEDTDAPTWELSGATSTYSNHDGANSLTFSSAFGILQGGMLVDTFNVTSATTALVAGGEGNDVFDVNATLTGQLSGEDGSDTFIINATVTKNIDGGADNDTLEGTKIDGVTLTGAGGVDGFDGNETSITGGFDNINVITGNGGTLKGLDDENGSAWDLVDDTFPGTYTALEISLSFGGFTTLQGGSAFDEFNINTTESFNLKGGLGADTFNLIAHLTGSINGEGDTDLLQGEAIDNVTLTNSAANGLSGNENSLTGGFSGIEALIGNGGTLTGISAVSTWTVSSNPQYKTGTAPALDIVGFTTLQGGSAADTFFVDEDVPFDLNGGLGKDKIVFNNAALTGGGTANGGGGDDTLDGQLASGAVSLFGGDGNDIVIGSNFGDSLDGGIGNDRLFGQAGDDTMSGGAGNDSLVGGEDNDRLMETVNGNATITNTKMTGGNGTDTLSQMEEIEITGNDGNNSLDASTYTLGRVILHGGEGNDTLSGGALFGDELDGGGGDDVVKSNVAGTVTLSDDELVSSGLTDVLTNVEAVSVTGSAGDDNIDASGFSHSVTINGGAGNDTLTGGSDADALNGGAGNDEISGGAGSDTLLGGAGNDILDGGEDNDRINGNDGNDLIEDTGITSATFANGVDDSIFGEGGNDSIKAGTGDDFVDAGAGNDTVFGEDGADNIAGGAGLDSIEGGAGADLLNGNADADRIEGGDDNDQIFGGAGSDVLLGEAGDDLINSQGGNDTMLGGSGNDSLVGGAGAELMFGDSPDEVGADEDGGNDTLNGGAGNDTLIGGDGDDSILGGAGKDLCLGGLGGNDTINGQGGTDTVYGGGDLDSLADPSKEAKVKISNAFIVPDSVEGYVETDANGQRYLSSHDYYFSLFDSTKFLDAI